MAEMLNFAGSNASFIAGKGTEERVGTLHGFKSPGGEVISRWRLTPQELKLVIERGGEIWLSQMTFNHPLQPALVSGFPLMELLDENGQSAGVYDPDATLANDDGLKAIYSFDAPE